MNHRDLVDVEEKQESFFSSFLKGKELPAKDGSNNELFQVTNPMFGSDKMNNLPPGFDDDDYLPGRVPSVAGGGPRPPEGFSLDFEVEEEEESKRNIEQKHSDTTPTAGKYIAPPPGFFSDDSGYNERSTKLEAPPPLPAGFFSDSEDSPLDKLRKDLPKRPESSSSEDSIPPPVPGSISLYFPKGVAGVSSPSHQQQHVDEQKKKEHDHHDGPHVAPELPPRRLKKTESSQQTVNLKKTESQQSVLNSSNNPVVLKKTESQQSVLNQDAGGEQQQQKEPMKRRRTSFLEMLIKQKQEKGEFNLEEYIEDPRRVLSPEEEQETGMSKQEIEEKIRRIAQAGASGHNTTAMGIGLRDIGFAVAKSRTETDAANKSRINVKSIAKHAEEMVIRNASSSQSQAEYSTARNNQGDFQRRASSNASTTNNVPPHLHPQHQKLLFDTIGEVSEGANSQDSFRSDNSLVRTKIRSGDVGGGKSAPNKGKTKTDRFFGSMRLNFNPPAQKPTGAAQKLKFKLQQMKVKAGEVAERLKETMKTIKERALQTKDQMKVYIAEHRRH